MVDTKLQFDWIGETPTKWGKMKIKYVVELRNQKVTEEQEILTYIGLENIESKTGKYLKNSTVEEQIIEGTSIKFYQGDILFGKLRPYLAKCIVANFDGKGTTELLVLKARQEKLVNQYLKYIMLSNEFIDLVNSSTYGAKMPRANWEFIGNQIIPIPNLETQRKIVNFLENKTTEIDTLIDDKEKLIKLLEEKRQAIITEAVTKGLNSDVKFKDSGVEWIGKIPEHWETIKAKHIFEERSIKGFPNETLLSVVKGKGVLPRNKLDFRVVMAFKDLQNFKLVRKNEFVIHLRSFQSGFELSKLNGIVSPAYTTFKAKGEDAIPGYYKYVFYTPYFIQYIGSTTQSLRDGKPISYETFLRC